MRGCRPDYILIQSYEIQFIIVLGYNKRFEHSYTDISDMLMLVLWVVMPCELVDEVHTALRYYPEHQHRHLHHRENLLSHTSGMFGRSILTVHIVSYRSKYCLLHKYEKLILKETPQDDYIEV